MYVASVRRIVIVALCWFVIAIVVFRAPGSVIFALPFTGPMFLVAILGVGTELRTSFASREQLSHTQRQTPIARAVLVLLACCSITGATTSVVPSMAFRTEGGDATYEYGLSRVIAPALWALILSTSIAVIARPTARRFALAASCSILAWPLFLGIRALREPLFDIDEEHLVLAPWALQLYVVAAVLASGLAFGLSFISVRAAARPVVLPAKALAMRPASK